VKGISWIRERRRKGAGLLRVVSAVVTGGHVRRFVSNANPLRLGFTLISRDGSLETAFELDQSARGSIPK
jgi:hypothetical protein